MKFAMWTGRLSTRYVEGLTVCVSAETTAGFLKGFSYIHLSINIFISRYSSHPTVLENTKTPHLRAF